MVPILIFPCVSLTIRFSLKFAQLILTSVVTLNTLNVYCIQEAGSHQRRSLLCINCKSNVISDRPFVWTVLYHTSQYALLEPGKSGIIKHGRGFRLVHKEIRLHKHTHRLLTGTGFAWINGWI